MANPTMLKFGYPDTLIKQWDHWAVLLRPAQVTVGSLVLVARSDATAYSQLPDTAFAEQAVVVRHCLFRGMRRLRFGPVELGDLEVFDPLDLVLVDLVVGAGELDDVATARTTRPVGRAAEQPPVPCLHAQGGQIAEAIFAGRAAKRGRSMPPVPSPSSW